MRISCAYRTRVVRPLPVPPGSVRFLLEPAFYLFYIALFKYATTHYARDECDKSGLSAVPGIPMFPGND